MPTISVPGQGMIKFPDTMAASDIETALQKMFPSDPRQFAPGVDKPGLPDSRTLPTPKNFPGFGNQPAEYAKRQEPVTRMMDGAARMTGAGADAKFGGASDIMRGAGEIALPLAAVPLAGAGSVAAGAGMLGRMAIGAGAGYATGKAARALVPEDKPGLQDFVENAGATAGGLLAGGGAESPKIGAFLKGAAKAAPTAMVRSGPYGIGGALMHALGHNKSALAADAVAAAAGLPTVIRGGMAEAAGKPWLGAGASRLFGVNKPQQAPPPNPQGLAAKQEAIRLRGLMDEAPSVIPQGPSPRITAATELPSGRPVGGIFNQTAPSPTPAPNPQGLAAKQESIRLRGLMDEAPSVIPQGPSPRITAATELPSGRPVGGIFNQTAPSPTPAPNPQGLAAKQESIRLRGLPFAPPVRVPPSTLEIPAPTQLPSGRPVGGIWNQNKPQTPAEIIAADAKSKAAIEALKARQAAKQNQRPAPTPKPAEKPTTPSENMAAKMAAQDAAGQERTGLMNDVVAEAEKRGAWNEAGGKFFENTTDMKQNALIKFAAEKGKPMQPFSESEYNALVKEFNATKPLHPTDGAPWRLERAGANYKPGKKAGRDVETTLRHFNNMRLGKE